MRQIPRKTRGFRIYEADGVREIDRLSKTVRSRASSSLSSSQDESCRVGTERAGVDTFQLTSDMKEDVDREGVIERADAEMTGVIFIAEADSVFLMVRADAGTVSELLLFCGRRPVDTAVRIRCKTMGERQQKMNRRHIQHCCADACEGLLEKRLTSCKTRLTIIMSTNQATE